MMRITKYYTGWCSRCSEWETDGMAETKKDCLASLKSFGWKVISGELLCPGCARLAKLPHIGRV